MQTIRLTKDKEEGTVKDQYVYLCLRLPKSMQETLKNLGKANDRSVSHEIRQAIRYYMSRYQAANAELLQPGEKE